MGNPVLVEVARGTLIESRHRGSVAVVDADGGTVLALGDVERPIFPRSAVKALQALPLVETGVADRFGLGDAELALACASHSGEPAHVEAAASMLRKAGRDGGCLECGAHWPMGEAAARALAAAGAEPGPLHNNCSGKHAGFVCLACGLHADPRGYVGSAHRVQAAVRAVLEEVTGVAHREDRAGIDGCSIPTYAVPPTALALGFARFGTGVGLSPDRAAARGRPRSRWRLSSSASSMSTATSAPPSPRSPPGRCATGTAWRSAGCAPRRRSPAPPSSRPTLSSSWSPPPPPSLPLPSSLARRAARPRTPACAPLLPGRAAPRGRRGQR